MSRWSPSLWRVAAVPPHEPLDIAAVMRTIRRIGRHEPRPGVSDRTIAHILGLGYLAGISGSTAACPFKDDGDARAWRIWHEGRDQGREHRARTHEGAPSLLTQRSIEAALIRLGQL